MHLRAGPSVHYKGSPDENCTSWEMCPECPCVSGERSSVIVCVIGVLCVVRVVRVFCVQCLRSIIVACCVGIKKDGVS